MTTGRECAWAKRSLEEQVYHDTEWGVPTHEDSVLFEVLVLGNYAGRTQLDVSTKTSRSHA